MLHAIKPMIWQALQTLKEPNEDKVKRSKLQVLSHNLSADGVLAELLTKFEVCAPRDSETVDTRLYLDTIIHEAVDTLTKAKSNKEQKICVERVHQVCWELCRAQLKGNNPSMLTDESTKIWWKIFTTFAERDSESLQTLYPVVMDWEEVDYWANVVLKVMALPTNSQSRKEREVLGKSVLTFQEALLRFNLKLNENNGMYVLDHEDKPDLKYVENAMQELNVRLFEGIHLNGSLTPVKKNHAQTPKWCVLYQRGMAFADNPADVDSSNPRAFIPIGACTEVTPIYDKSQRPVRFLLKNGKDAKEPLVFEANNISVRNKWVTAIICLKFGKLPDYEKDFLNRRQARLKNRQFEAEAKETMRQQKERTKKQMEGMTRALEEERERHKWETNATAEQMQERIEQHNQHMDALMQQMTELGAQYEAEKTLLTEQHEREMQQLLRQHGAQLGSVKNEMESETERLKEMLDSEQANHKEELEKRDARIRALEEEVAQLKRLLASLTKEKEESTARFTSEAEKAAEANSRLTEEARRMASEVTELRHQLRDAEQLRQQREQDTIKLDELIEENNELKSKTEKLEKQIREARRNMIRSELHDEDEQLHEAIFRVTGFNRQDRVMNENVNDFSIQTAGSDEQ